MEIMNHTNSFTIKAVIHEMFNNEIKIILKKYIIKNYFFCIRQKKWKLEIKFPLDTMTVKIYLVDYARNLYRNTQFKRGGKNNNHLFQESRYGNCILPAMPQITSTKMYMISTLGNIFNSIFTIMQ